MTHLLGSSSPRALNIALGLFAIAVLGGGAFATAGPVPPTIAFGAATGKPQAPGAAVYGVALGGTPAAPTLTATLLNQSPEPAGVQPPVVSSLAYVQNSASGTVDLLASNSIFGDTYTLPGPSYSTSSVFFRTGVPECGAHAAGLGVDASGTILAAGNFTSTNCPTQLPGQLGVFYYYTSDGTFPVLMDDFNADANLAGGSAITSIVDAVVAPSNFANGIHAGDLLVLVGDTYSAGAPPVVVLYPHSVISQNLPFGFPVAAASALVTESMLPIQAPYDHPVSMAISPLDGSILITTTDGTIWQLAPAQNGYASATIYAQPISGLPRGCFEDCGLQWGKIGAGLIGGGLYVVATVADTYGSTVNESGILAMFSGPLPQGSAYYSAPSATVNITAVQPSSVAVLPYRTGTTSVANCFNTPCDVLGDGVMLTTIRGNTQGIPPGATITQQECVVLADPRGPHCGAGTPGGLRSLPLNQVCPGLSDSLVIPSYLCGSAGASGIGFVVIEGTAEQEDNTTGIEVITNAKTTPVLGSDPGCPADHVGYQRNDHSLVETDFPEYPQIFEVTNSCSPDPTNKNGPHNSTDIVGLEVANLGQVFGGPHKSGPVGFVDFKFNNLQQTIKNSNIKYPWERIVLSASVTIAKYLVDIGHYDCAAEIMYLLDQFVRRHVGDFLHSVPGAAVREPNPAFDIIMRLSNGFYSIETGILNKPAYPNWPLTADPRLCRTTECRVPGMDK